MAEERDFNDILHDIVLSEEAHEKESYKEGYQAGVESGNADGFHLGYHKGFQLGQELGMLFNDNHIICSEYYYMNIKSDFAWNAMDQV